MAIEVLNDRSADQFISNGGGPALLFFHAKSSKPARQMVSLVAEISNEYDSVVRFGQIDADESPLTVNKYGILSLPSYLIFRNGRLTDRFIGVRTKEKFTERIEESLKWV